jgi:hypothetical protein
MAVTGGIFGGDREEIARGVAELERKEALATQQEAAAAELAAELEATLDRIEKAITVYVADELQAEFAAQKQTEEAEEASASGCVSSVQAVLRQILPSLAAPSCRAGGHRSLSGFRDGKRAGAS